MIVYFITIDFTQTFITSTCFVNEQRVLIPDLDRGLESDGIRTLPKICGYFEYWQRKRCSAVKSEFTAEEPMKKKVRTVDDFSHFLSLAKTRKPRPTKANNEKSYGYDPKRPIYLESKEDSRFSDFAIGVIIARGGGIANPNLKDHNISLKFVKKNIHDKNKKSSQRKSFPEIV